MTGFNEMITKFKKASLAVAISLTIGVTTISATESAFTDFDYISNYAKKSVANLELSGVLASYEEFQPQEYADKTFAKQVLGTLDDIGYGELSYGEAIYLAEKYRANAGFNDKVSVEGFLSKKNYQLNDLITREDFAYLITHANQEDIKINGEQIHNPAIATPGPLLGPTVYQSGENTDGPVFDGSTISAFHRAKQSLNTTFNDQPAYTLQVHPEVFKSVSVGGISVSDLSDLTAQLEVELNDGTIHRTSLNSLIEFSIHGADGKVNEIRVEDGILLIVDDLQGYVNSFNLNGHEITSDYIADKVLTQAYKNGDQTDAELVDVVINELNDNGFSLQDRRTIIHNVILNKTALQQSGLSPLSAPFNTIAGPSSAARGFAQGYLYDMYKTAYDIHLLISAGDTQSVRGMLNNTETQQKLLNSSKILTAATLLPHITNLADAPFLPNEALTSRVKKSGALLPSEPFVFQHDRLKRAAYILLDDALSNGNASHLLTTGEIARIEGEDSNAAFTLIGENFHGTAISVNDTVVNDAVYDFLDAYKQSVQMISGIDFDGYLVNLGDEEFNKINEAFSNPILNDALANVKIGNLDFKMDLLATPSHIGDSFKPANPLTTSRSSEVFGLAEALEPFPTRLAQYVCAGEVVTPEGDFITNAKIDSIEQVDLIEDFSTIPNESCQSAITAPRYHQLLFVDNFQLPPFGPQAKFITSQGIEIINRILLTPVNSSLNIKDIRLSYRVNTPLVNQAPVAKAAVPQIARSFRFGFLNAGASSDTNNDQLQYKWTVKSGEALIFQNEYIPYALFLPLSRSPLKLELQVNDGIANSKIVEKTINIR